MQLAGFCAHKRRPPSLTMLPEYFHTRNKEIWLVLPSSPKTTLQRTKTFLSLPFPLLLLLKSVLPSSTPLLPSNDNLRRLKISFSCSLYRAHILYYLLLAKKGRSVKNISSKRNDTLLRTAISSDTEWTSLSKNIYAQHNVGFFSFHSSASEWLFYTITLYSFLTVFIQLSITLCSTGLGSIACLRMAGE